MLDARAVAAPAGAVADDLDIVIGRKPMRIMSDDHDRAPAFQ